MAISLPSVNQPTELGSLFLMFHSVVSWQGPILSLAGRKLRTLEVYGDSTPACQATYGVRVCRVRQER
jgi:hypothetical protein